MGVTSSFRGNGEIPSVRLTVLRGSFGDEVAGPNTGVGRSGCGPCDTWGEGEGT